MSIVDKRYQTDDYVKKNPTWDREDSPWKAERVKNILSCSDVMPISVCEVGCGAGEVLKSLSDYYPEAYFSGFDIAPAAANFWKEIKSNNINLRVGDFFTTDNGYYDVLLLLDVLEHVGDPHKFLVGLCNRADYFVIHFPLDLSAINVFREQPLINVRQKVGHIHYFTKGLALSLLDECGYEIIDCQYTGAAFNTPKLGLKTRLAQLPRFITHMLNKDYGVRLLGGETLMVLARAK